MGWNVRIEWNNGDFGGLGKNLPDHLEIDFNDSESKQASDVREQFKKAGTRISMSDARAILKKLRKNR